MRVEPTIDTYATRERVLVGVQPDAYHEPERVAFDWARAHRPQGWRIATVTPVRGISGNFRVVFKRGEPRSQWER